MKAESESVIDVYSLTKRYGDFYALKNLSLHVKRGDVFGFLGHNGAGKTTTINLLTTLLEPTAGTALVAGFDIKEESLEVRKKIGYLPENVQLYDSLTVYENLEYFAKLSGIKECNERILEVLEFIDMAQFKNRKVGTLSKGMRQRIGIAQAIQHKPRILFLDEPTSGLDPFGVKQLRETILQLNKDAGMTIFMNTHRLSEVTQTCSTIGVLSHGELIYVDSLANTLKHFKDEFSLEQIYLTIENGAENHA